jgi:hypothetical protein
MERLFVSLLETLREMFRALETLQEVLNPFLHPKGLYSLMSFDAFYFFTICLKKKLRFFDQLFVTSVLKIFTNVVYIDSIM